MKFLLLVADGMGDWPVESLGGKTPLEVAHTPNLDALARKGVLGRCHTVPLDMAPGSDVANMSLLGYDPKKYHTGRGPIEAAAQGLKLHPTDLIFRCNLVTVTSLSPDGTMLDYSSGHIDTAAAHTLITKLKSELDDDLFTLYPGVQYRHLLIQKNGAETLEAKLSIRPPHDITDQPIEPDRQTMKQSPRLWSFMEKANRILAQPDNSTKANSLWPWGQGRPMILPDFQKQFGLYGAVISAVDLVKGLGQAANMTVIDVPGATGLLDTNYAGKVHAALDSLITHDFVYLHVEAPDECGHAGDANQKIEAIQRFDTQIVGPLRQALPEDKHLYLVTCDHYTPIVKRTHTSDPVPFVLAGPNVQQLHNNSQSTFSEQTASQSDLIFEDGQSLLNFALKTFNPNRTNG